MPELNLPNEDELDDLDFDDFYDAVETYVQDSLKVLSAVHIVPPSISHDDLLVNASQLIPLRKRVETLQRAFAILEEELDTGHLQVLAQPLLDTAEKLLQSLKNANEMIYLLDEIKKTRKKSRRVTKKLKRLRQDDRLSDLQSEADTLRGLADFSGRIEGYRARGFNVSGLLAAHKQMEDQIDKTQEAFDSRQEEQTEKAVL